MSEGAATGGPAGRLGPPARTDTWMVHEDAATWIIRGPSALEPSRWERWALSAFDAGVVELATVFRPRAVRVRFADGETDADPTDPTAVRTTVAERGAPLREIEADLDVRGWYVDLDGRLVHDWLALPGELVVTRTDGTGSSETYLRVHHTLFGPDDPAVPAPNYELYGRNAPLLGAALARWERSVGAITEVEGRCHPFRYGFADVRTDRRDG